MSDKIRVQNKVVGHIEGDTFYKQVEASRHFLRRPPAIAFDVSTLDDAEKKGAKHVCVTDRETWKVYHARMDTVRDKGFAFNRGYGDQIALPLTEWSPSRVNIRQAELFSWEEIDSALGEDWREREHADPPGDPKIDDE